MTESGIHRIADYEEARRQALAVDEVRTNAALLRAAAKVIESAPAGSQKDYFERLHEDRKRAAFTRVLEGYKEGAITSEDAFGASSMICDDTAELSSRPYEVRVTQVVLQNVNPLTLTDGARDLLELAWAYDREAASIENQKN